MTHAALADTALRALREGRLAEAVASVRRLAEQGEPAAQLCLGRMALSGQGMARDAQAARLWFTRAARGGDAEAMNMLGRCFEAEGEFSQAAVWYERAARQGDSWAQYNLGHLLLDGLGVKRDQAAAFAWYCRAAAAGHARAMNLVGRCLEHGWGTARDMPAAALAYRRSAEAGYFRGAFNHALICWQEGDHEAAAHWLRAAHAHGTPEVQARATTLLARLASGEAACSHHSSSPVSQPA